MDSTSAFAAASFLQYLCTYRLSPAAQHAMALWAGGEAHLFNKSLYFDGNMTVYSVRSRSSRSSITW